MEMNILAGSAPVNVRIPKVIAEIVICGALHIKIDEDTANWIPPTVEQKENLKKLLNIEVFEYGDKTEKG
jgi:hypothetical protein